MKRWSGWWASEGQSFPQEARQPGPVPERTRCGSFFSVNDPRRQSVARGRGPALPPGCITTPCPSLTSSCSSTTIYGCGSLTERQTPPHRRGPARQRSCQSPRALRRVSVAARPGKATGRKRRYPADPWLTSPVVKAGPSEPAVESRGGAGVPTADMAVAARLRWRGSVQLKRLR